MAASKVTKSRSGRSAAWCPSDCYGNFDGLRIPSASIEHESEIATIMPIPMNPSPLSLLVPTNTAITKGIKNVKPMPTKPRVHICLPSALRTVTTSSLRQSSPEHSRPSFERFPMRPVLQCILLLSSLATPAYAQQLKEITNSIGMKLVLIHPGSFTMGSAEEESGRKDRELRHEVILSKSFYLGVYEVTQGQYEHVIGTNPNRSKTNALQNVSWEDAVAFCTKLSELPEEKAAGRVYRLPTEAEWEYACRATSGAAYSFGDSADLLGDFAWFKEDRMLATLPVGLKKANRWGLYDMHGNVYEWCHDWYADYPSSEVTDPQGPRIGSERVFRGGCSSDVAANCRSSYRYSIVPTFSSYEFGLRVAMSAPAKQPMAASAK